MSLEKIEEANMTLDDMGKVQKKQMTVDEILEEANSFGPFQWVLWIFFFFLMLGEFFPVLIFFFAAMESDWRCTANSTVCNFTEPVGRYDDNWTMRCDSGWSRSDWEHVKPVNFSIMTEFDLYCDTQFWKPLMTSIIFAPWAIGGVVLGWCADRFGRKRVMFISLFMELLCMVCSIAAYHPWGILLCRIVIGFFLPGAMIQQYIMGVEFSPAKRRNLFVNGLAIGWCFCGAIQALMAYYITTWKNLILVQSVPFVILLPMYYFVPESLRYYNTHGRTDDAMWELKRIARFNGRTISDDIEILPEAEEVESMDPRLLFKTRKAAVTTLIQSIDWIVLGLGYYGLLLAAETGIDMNLFLLYAVMSLCEGPGTALCIPLLNIFGRKPTIVAVQAFSGICCFVIAFIPDEGNINYFRIVLAVIAKATCTGAFDSTYLWSSEIHPTTLRANALGYLQVTARIGSVITPWIADGLLEENKMAPFILIGGLLFIAACLKWFLPETKSLKTNETLAEYYGYDKPGRKAEPAVDHESTTYANQNA